ncbi:MAG: hypothetical protein ACOCVC_04100 [Spirochaeta sp.]
MVFDWDEANRTRHHISFEDARYEFADSFAVTRVDYTGEEVIRIISVRKVTSQEKRRYENNTWI